MEIFCYKNLQITLKVTQRWFNKIKINHDLQLTQLYFTDLNKSFIAFLLFEIYSTVVHKSF